VLAADTISTTAKPPVALGILRFAGRLAQRLAVAVVAGIYPAVRHCPCLCDEGILIWAATDRESAYRSRASARHAEHYEANGGKCYQPSKLHRLCLVQTIGTRYCTYLRATDIKLQPGKASLFPTLGYVDLNSASRPGAMSLKRPDSSGGRVSPSEFDRAAHIRQGRFSGNAPPSCCASA
jgi:hypothetical protein